MRNFAILASLITGASCFQAPLHLGNPSRVSLSVVNTNSLRPSYSCPHQRSVPLYMATDEAGEDAKETKKKEVSPEKVKGRKKRVILGYKIMTAAYSMFGAAMFGMSKNPFYSSGPLLTAGISYIMIGAAENNRLSSDTYKRLNIVLMEYGLVGFAAGIFMKLNPLWMITCFVAFVNSIKGYGYGLKGWELAPACALEDLKSGMKGNVKTMFQIPNIKSAGYEAATLTVGYLKLTKLVEVIKLMMSDNIHTLGTRLFALSRLIVATIVLYTLKDAADRDRLEGTTFIELNALSALSLATWAMYEKLTTPFGKAFAFFSIFSAFNGVHSIMKKNNSK